LNTGKKPEEFEHRDTGMAKRQNDDKIERK
jgi:hypothetical protein